MPREAIGMTPEEVRAFFAAQTWVALGTLDVDGAPVGDLAPVRVDGERLRFAVLRGSRAHDNIARDPRVCCAADEFPSYYEIRGAVAHGVARACAGGGLAPDWIEYAVDLDDVSSFDFRRIRGRS